jgi:transposase InsO family protein
LGVPKAADGAFEPIQNPRALHQDGTKLGSLAAPGPYHRQPPRPADRTEPDRARPCGPAPNRIWLADITYIPTAEGWLCLDAVMELFSRKIVGWAVQDHMQVELASAALTIAIEQQRRQAGLIHHSDRGA